jgi:hypothetical protein
MRKWAWILVSVALIALLGLVAVMFIGWPLGEPRLTLTGGGSSSVGDTSVTFVRSDRGLAIVIWSDAVGASGSGTESGLFSSTARGHFTAADGSKIHWSWHGPREKGGDFQLDGQPYDLANGTVILVATKGGKVRVTQLDVDLSKVPPNVQGIKALAKSEARVARFVADAAGKK